MIKTLPSPALVGIPFGAHDRTLHLQAIVRPAAAASNVTLNWSAQLTLSQGSADTTTGIIPFDVVGNTASDPAVPDGDSSIVATDAVTGSVVGRQLVSVVVPARIGTPHHQDAATVHGFNGLFNASTVPPWGSVFDPYVQRASMYAVINHVIVWDQFDQPIGSADLYGGARIFEDGVDIGVVLLSNSIYEDRVGIGVAVGPPIQKTSPAAAGWLNNPMPRPAPVGTFDASVRVQIDGNLAWTLDLVDRQVSVTRTGPGEAHMQIIWP
jgi:hypothetical protein